MSYVVNSESSLPYFESRQEYNSLPTQKFIGQLVHYDGDESYLLVDNKGKIMKDKEFERNQSREYSEELVIAEKMKNYPLYIVKHGSFYVTTPKDEIIALFNGERIVLGAKLEKVLEDNKKAYDNKDYMSIMNYFKKTQTQVYRPHIDPNGIKKWLRLS